MQKDMIAKAWYIDCTKQLKNIYRKNVCLKIGLSVAQKNFKKAYSKKKRSYTYFFFYSISISKYKALINYAIVISVYLLPKN